MLTGEQKQHNRIRALYRKGGKADEREFERLYLESYGLVYGYVRARMTCDADTEDVVAEAFLKAARAFNRFDPSRSKFSTWVVTIARNCMVSHYRKERSSAALDDVPESFAAAEGGQSAVDDRDLALRLLSVLDDEERELVLLKYREGLRNVEIAKDLGMNASTVSTVLARAMTKMRGAAERNA